MSKKLVSLLLAAVLLVISAGALTVTASADTALIPDADLERWAVKRAVLTEGTYNPNEPVTVERFLDALWAVNGRPAAQPEGNGQYAEALGWAAEMKIHSTPNTNFMKADSNVTRIQCLFMLYLLSGQNGGSGLVHYTDTYKTAYYIKALDWAFMSGLCDRPAGGSFLPHYTCTMRTALTFLYLYDGMINPVKYLSEYKWVAFGNSLTDDTGDCGRLAPNKYHKIISEATGMEVEVVAKGGTGYWRSENTGSCYYQRMQKLDVDPYVDVVTIFGSVNDWRYWRGNTRTSEAYYDIPTMGLDKNGNPYTFAAFHREQGNYTKITKAFAAEKLLMTDTVASTKDTEYGTSWVAYVNECINTAHEKFPNAKIVLVDEVYFVDTRFYEIQSDLRTIKKALVDYRIANGDTWLSLYELEESTFPGLDVPERLYVDTIPGEGLSLDQLTDKEFAAYYTYDGKGHPTDLYHRIWLAPMYANILCGALGVDPDTLPPELRID